MSKGNTYTVQQVKSDRVLLKEIYSWVPLDGVQAVSEEPMELIGNITQICTAWRQSGSVPDHLSEVLNPLKSIEGRIES